MNLEKDEKAYFTYVCFFVSKILKFEFPIFFQKSRKNKDIEYRHLLLFVKKKKKTG